MHQFTLTLFLAVGLLTCVHCFTIGRIENAQYQMANQASMLSNGSGEVDQHTDDVAGGHQVNMGGTGGSGNAQAQFGDNWQGEGSGGNGGAGGQATGENFGGVMNNGPMQDQNGNGFMKRNFDFGDSVQTAGDGGNGNAQAQFGDFGNGIISGGNGGNGGSVFGKRNFDFGDSVQTAGDGGNGNAQAQFGEFGNGISSGGNGGNVFR